MKEGGRKQWKDRKEKMKTEKEAPKKLNNNHLIVVPAIEKSALRRFFLFL